MRTHNVAIAPHPAGGSRCTCTCGWKYHADPSNAQHWFEALLARSAHILASSLFEALR